VKTLCNCLKRHAVAFILNMLKTNAAAWRLHSMLDSALCSHCGNAVVSVSAPRACCIDAFSILDLDSAFAMHFDNNISNHKM